MIIGTVIIAGLTLILSIYGAALVGRASSSIMTLIIIVAITIIIIASLDIFKWRVYRYLFQSSFSTFLIIAAIWSAIIYAGFQASGNITILYRWLRD